LIDLETFLLVLPILLASLTLHELAHGLTATALGDPTPREHGRLTLNPIPHLDPIGTLLLVVTLLTTTYAFGWAKPVLVNPRYFRRPREGMAIVAAAGPATNFVLALACLVPIRYADPGDQLTEVLSVAFQINVVLAFFNLLPIPPLDGSRVVAVLMSRELYAQWARFDQYGFLVLLGMVFLFREQFQEIYLRTMNAVAGIMGLQFA
jgi:Zn-dependent protease